MSCLGDLHFVGLGCENDLNKSIIWYKRAAKRGHQSSLTKLTNLAIKKQNAYAQYILGGLYFDALGVEQDRKRAAELYNMAANQELASAQYELGYMCLVGKDLPKDEGRAFKLFNLASEQKHPHATTCLAWMFEKGKFVKPDMKKAIELYQQGAIGGNEKAQKKIAELCPKEPTDQPTGLAGRMVVKDDESELTFGRCIIF